jgi:hypothetical protein
MPTTAMKPVPTAKVPVGEDRQGEDRLVRGQLAQHEPDEPRDRDDPECHDRPRVEPLLTLAAIQHQLQAGEAHHHQHESERVDPSRLFEVRRVEQERAGHEEAGEPDRQVDVEDPAPRPVVRDPASERGSEDRAHHDSDAPHGHRQAALFEREDLPHDRLGHRDDRPAPDPLEDARHDQEFEVGRNPREERGDREQGGADQEESPASEER